MSGSGSGPGKRAPRPGGATANGSLYERYKDALRRGHVASLRGRNDAAVDAYGEAATIAPDRALPHTSIGGVLVKMGRLDDAIAALDRALELAPRDESALRGLSEVHVKAGRRADAAAALDRLADSLDAAGRLADATDAARRALELAESRPRRKQVEGFAARLRASSPNDEAAQLALDQALRVLAPNGTAPARGETAEPAIAETASEVEQGELEPTSEPSERTASHEQEAVEAGEREKPEEQAKPEEPGEPDPVEPAEPIGLGIALGAAAEAALHAGDLAAAHEGLLAAARAHRRAGRLSAALDSCDLAIGLAPSDPDVHLLLAELYLDRGWFTLAIDKLLLLGRLADLDGDAEVHDRLCALVEERLPDEPRMAELCA